MNGNEPDESGSPLVPAISYFLRELAYGILLIAGKALCLSVLWNLVMPSLFGLSNLNIGQAFILILLILLLFSNMDGYSKYQTRHLFDLKSLLFQLIQNQIVQNNAIMSLLSRSKEVNAENANTVPKTEQLLLDESLKRDYNTNDSEKK